MVQYTMHIMYMYVHTYMHAHARTHVRTHTHTHTTLTNGVIKSNGEHELGGGGPSMISLITLNV